MIVPVAGVVDGLGLAELAVVDAAADVVESADLLLELHAVASRAATAMIAVTLIVWVDRSFTVLLVE
jgi:hypothetical protein